MTRALKLVVLALMWFIATGKVTNAQAETVPCVRKVFITGRQDYAIAWASTNLSKKTCMIPVNSYNEAEAILDLEPNPDLVAMDQRMSLADVPSSPANYSVSCVSGSQFTRCTDSNGHFLETDCTDRKGQVRCTTYDGQSLAPVVGALGWAAIHHLLLRNAANAFMYDKQGHLLWSFTGSKPWEVALAQGMNCMKGSHMNGWPYNKLGNKGKSDTCPAPDPPAAN